MSDPGRESETYDRLSRVLEALEGQVEAARVVAVEAYILGAIDAFRERLGREPLPGAELASFPRHVGRTEAAKLISAIEATS